MNIPYTLRYCIAIMASIFVLGQLHEMAHLFVVQLVCGCAGRQIDLNLWTTGAQCNNSQYTYLATLAGPVFSYAMIWAGHLIFRKNDARYWPFPFVLVMGNLVFARLFTAAMGGGDEITVIKALLLPHIGLWGCRVLGFAIVASLTLPPILLLYKRITNDHKVWVLLAFCILPMPVMYLYEFKLLGIVLHSGWLSTRRWLGVPDLVYLHTLAMAALALVLNPARLRPAAQLGIA